jgi:hypothetical protein
LEHVAGATVAARRESRRFVRRQPRQHRPAGPRGAPERAARVRPQPSQRRCGQRAVPPENSP